ncbi:MAG: PfkB family carbohydrate kinase, partial [Candidatus Acidiferrales bacterium]
LEFKCRLAGATIGRLGVITWDGSKFRLCPGFRVRVADTTGAGDIFHGAFAYGLVQKWSLEETLEFSCAAAALNCEGYGARGGIGTLPEIERLRHRGERSEHAYSVAQLARAAQAASGALRDMDQ